MDRPRTRPVADSPGYGNGAHAIVEATIDVVAARGLHGMTFRAVAERARVNNSLIAYHFGNREGLLEAAVQWSVERAVDITGLAQWGANPHADAELLADMVDENPELYGFQYEIILESRRNPTFAARTQNLYEEYVAALAASPRFEALGIQDPSLTKAAFAALDGLVLQYFTGAMTRHEFLDAHSTLVSLVTTVGNGTAAT